MFSYYNNTIRANAGFVDRFFEESYKGPNNKNEDGFFIYDMNGVFFVSINNGIIVKTSENTTDEINNFALQVQNKNSESGIIGNYIYKKRIHETKDNDIEIILIESSGEINRIKLVFTSSIIIACIGIVLIYFLSKKIAMLIVKPVEETFNKQKDFISDASHELKTPLAVIQANADVLEGDIGKNKWLSYIQNEIENMGKLINELLLLTKIENVEKLRNPEKFNMSDYVELVVLSFESMAFEKNVKLEKCDDMFVTRLHVDHIDKELMDYKYNSGFFFENDIDNLSEIVDVCDVRCQTLTYFGVKEEDFRTFLEKARPWGIDRIVPIGKSMDFSLIWDGYDLIRQMSRRITII